MDNTIDAGNTTANAYAYANANTNTNANGKGNRNRWRRKRNKNSKYTSDTSTNYASTSTTSTTSTTNANTNTNTAQNINMNSNTNTFIETKQSNDKKGKNKQKAKPKPKSKSKPAKEIISEAKAKIGVQLEKETETAIDKMQIVRSSLDCPICIELFCEPIPLACGHTFCRECLIKSVNRNRSCPSCRFETHIVPNTAAVNISLQEICKTVDEVTYNKKLQELNVFLDKIKSSLPIFFYNTPIIGDTLDLHLFEPRYRLMIQRIKDSTPQEFLIYNPHGSEEKPIGVIMRVKRLEIQFDGRCLISIMASQRCYVEDVHEEANTYGLNYANTTKVIDNDENDFDSHEMLIARNCVDRFLEILYNPAMSHSKAFNDYAEGKVPSFPRIRTLTKKSCKFRSAKDSEPKRCK